MAIEMPSERLLRPFEPPTFKKSNIRHKFSESSKICSLAYLFYMKTIVVHISGLGLT
jgi:hypothetical protein